MLTREETQRVRDAVEELWAAIPIGDAETDRIHEAALALLDRDLAAPELDLDVFRNPDGTWKQPSSWNPPGGLG